MKKLILILSLLTVNSFAATAPKKDFTALVVCDLNKCDKLATFDNDKDCQDASNALLLLSNRFKTIAPKVLVCVPSKSIKIAAFLVY